MLSFNHSFTLIHLPTAVRVVFAQPGASIVGVGGMTGEKADISYSRHF